MLKRNVKQTRKSTKILHDDLPKYEVIKHIDENRVLEHPDSKFDVDFLPYIVDERDKEMFEPAVKKRSKVAAILKPTSNLIQPSNSIDSRTDLSSDVDLLDRKMKELNQQLFDIEKDIQYNFPINSSAQISSKTKNTTSNVEITFPELPDFKLKVPESDPSYEIRNEIIQYRQSMKNKMFEEKIDRKLAILSGHRENEEKFDNKRIENEKISYHPGNIEINVGLNAIPEETTIQESFSKDITSHSEKSIEGKVPENLPSLLSSLKEVNLVEDFLTQTQKELVKIQSDFDDCLKSTSRLVSQSSQHLTSEVNIDVQERDEKKKSQSSRVSKSTPKLSVSKTSLKPRPKSNKVVTQTPKNNSRRTLISKKPLVRQSSKWQDLNKIDVVKTVGELKVSSGDTDISKNRDFDKEIGEENFELIASKIDVPASPTSASNKYPLKSNTQNLRNDDFSKKINEVFPEFSTVNISTIQKFDKVIQVDLPEEHSMDEPDKITNPMCEKLSKLTIHSMPKLEIRGPLVLNKMPNVVIIPQKLSIGEAQLKNVYYEEISHDKVKLLPENIPKILVDKMLQTDENEEEVKESNIEEDMPIDYSNLPTIQSLITIQKYLESKKSIIRENFLKHNTHPKLPPKMPFISTLRYRNEKLNTITQESDKFDEASNISVPRNDDCSTSSKSLISLLKSPKVDKTKLKIDKAVSTLKNNSDKNIQCELSNKKRNLGISRVRFENIEIQNENKAIATHSSMTQTVTVATKEAEINTDKPKVKEMIENTTQTQCSKPAESKNSDTIESDISSTHKRQKTKKYTKTKSDTDARITQIYQQDIAKYSNQYDNDKNDDRIYIYPEKNISKISIDSTSTIFTNSTENNLSDGEIDLQCKCSISLGEIHICRCTKNTNIVSELTTTDFSSEII